MCLTKKRQQQHEVPDTSVRVHESGYIMRRGEHISFKYYW